jgi:hypothetical protein
LKEGEHKYNLLKQQKMNDYYMEKNVEKMKGREIRIEEFRLDKIIFRKQKGPMELEKKKAQEYIMKKKQDDQEFYDKITMKSSQITMEDLQEMFPGDEKIVDKFIKFKEEKGEYSPNYSKTMRNNMSHDNYKNSNTSFDNVSFDYVKNNSFNKSFDKIY